MSTPEPAFAAVAATLAGVDPEDDAAVEKFYRERFAAYPPPVRALISDFLLGMASAPTPKALQALKEMVTQPEGDLATLTAAWQSPKAAAREGGPPSPIDLHVGTRIRLRRTLLGLSQERLGEALGLTFQQVQKYERGVNRVGASRLFDLSKVLDVPIGFFFEALPGATRAQLGQTAPRGFAETQQEIAEPGDEDLLHRRETLELVRAYSRITDPAVRRRVFDLVRTMAAEASPE